MKPTQQAKIKHSGRKLFLTFFQFQLKVLILSKGDCKRPCFDQLHAHTLERQQNSKRSKMCATVRSADQSMAAHNRPLDSIIKRNDKFTLKLVN